MLRLRLRNAASARTKHQRPYATRKSDYPLKPRIHRVTKRQFQIVSLPQKDGSFVASVVEAPEIVVYDKSRKAAEEEAVKRFVQASDYRAHPLATSQAVTVDLEHDDESGAFVTYVKELHGMSTFGDTELEALNRTAEMIRGYIKSMEANGKKIPMAGLKLAELKRLVGVG